jgi:hypothetical protein
MIPLEESPTAVHEEKLQEQKRGKEQTHQESSFRKKKQEANDYLLISNGEAGRKEWR